MASAHFCAFLEGAFAQLNAATEFLPNWHIELIAAELEKCRMGETKRLIINVPPRSLKSHCTSIALPAWILGHNPTAQIVCASYSQDLSDKLAMDCRTLMLSEFYEKIFSTRISPHKRSVSDFATTQGGMRFATSVGGALLGRGADFIVIDDPLKPDEALSDVQRGNANNWFDHTVLSRLNNKLQGRIILIMQRLHEDDLTGHLLQQGGWKLLRLPAIAEEEERFVAESRFGVSTFSRKVGEALHPDREPTEVLETLRKAQGEYTFAGQYQQAPAPLGGGLVKRAWFRTYTPDEVPGKFELIFQSWDTASKASELSDYSACVTVGLKERRLYVLDVFRKRMEYPELKREVHSQAQKYSPKTILIEDKSSGTPLIQELIQERVYAAQRYTPAMDKIMRLHSVTSIIENGFLYLPEKAEWLAAYLHEMTTFPNGRNDDQADATSQALDWVRERWREPAIITFTRMECERMGFRTPNR